jgi:glycosyltransferase involved in cell wall biosynthesis
MTPQISIIIPCLNEAETLGACLRKARECAERNGWDAEIVVADNGSTDDSAEVALAFGARVVPVEKRGYGHALREGMRAARGRLFILGDADDSYDFGRLASLL